MGWTRTKYDQVGRIIDVDSFAGATAPGSSGTGTNGQIGTAYDASSTSGSNMGAITKVTDQAGNATQQVMDGMGRLRTVTEDFGHSNVLTSYSYNLLDDLTGVTQGTLAPRQFTYDSLRRLSTAVNPESSLTCYGTLSGSTCTPSYDLDGNLLTKTDARNTVTTITYDALNRQTQKSYVAGGDTAATSTVTYTYYTNANGVPNGIGRLASVANSVSTTTYGSYDQLGRVTASSQSTVGQLYGFSNYSYNLAGGLKSMTYPSGSIVATSYDQAGRVTGVIGTMGSVNTTYASGATYAAHGAIQQVNLNPAGSLIETTSYGPDLQPYQASTGSVLTLKTYRCTGQTISCSTNNGNILEQWINVPGTPGMNLIQEYSYDRLNRVVGGAEESGTASFTVPSSSCGGFGGTWCQLFAYDDGAGNDNTGNRRLVDQAGVGLAPWAVSNFNTTNNQISDSGWGYDPARNITTAPGNQTIAYDAEAHQVVFCAAGPSPCPNAAGAGRTLYGYDGLGQRVLRTNPDTTQTVFVYDANGHMAAEYTTQTPSPPICATCFVSVDYLGSTRLLTDSSGLVQERHDYLPFGGEIPAPSGSPRLTVGNYVATASVRELFTGKERDAETGLDWFERRYFSGAQGRFTSPDPLGGHIEDPQSLNRYVYARNNPLRYTDSTGLDFYLDCKDKSDTCQGGRVGTTDDKGKFTATLISNDKNGGLVDQNGNQFTGSFDQHGISFTDSNGNDYSGRFAANTAATTLSGSGIFAGFTGVFNSNGLNTNIAQGSLFGSPQAFQALLTKLVGPNVGLDALNGFHPGSIQYRGGNDNGPDPHLSFDSNHQPGANGLLFQPFHYDGAFPFGDVSGFVEHTSSVLKSLFETKVLRQKDVPPPVSIPH